MTDDIFDSATTTVELLYSDTTYSIHEICRLCEVEVEELPLYIEHGIIVAEAVDARLFNHRQIERLQSALRLQADLEVNHAGAALALDLLEAIAVLERKLALLTR